MMRWIWRLLVLLVLLAGCGGAASQPTPVAEEPTAFSTATDNVRTKTNTAVSLQQQIKRYLL
jgi:ABC-type glycerol-3-phosphate transport system substrate-binding protein